MALIRLSIAMRSSVSSGRLRNSCTRLRICRKRLRERGALFLVAAFNSRRIGKAPVRGDRLTRPQRANLTRRVVADCNDEVHLRRTGLRQTHPSFCCADFDWITKRPHLFDGEGIDRRWDGCPRCRP